MDSSETEMWAVSIDSTFYIARLVVTNHLGERSPTEITLGRTTLPDLRKALKVKGLEPLRLVDEPDGDVLEYWV